MAIQLHCDLQVAAGHEAEIERVFLEIFSPVMARQNGFMEVRFLKLDGGADQWSYRLLIGFQSEELRQAWAASDDHQQVWPQMEAHLAGEKFRGALYQVTGAR
ncbi:MAG: antibiotic biosynthesis monooxygenase [Acidobacteriota bacterium]